MCALVLVGDTVNPARGRYRREREYERSRIQVEKAKERDRERDRTKRRIGEEGAVTYLLFYGGTKLT